MENSQSNSNNVLSFSSPPVTASAPVKSGSLADEVLRIFPSDPAESYVTVSDVDVKKLRELAGA